METYYFTYGSCDENQPFAGGWTEITAPDEETACALHHAVHPSDGFLRCAGIYDEATFKASRMWKEGNFGARCHERITVTRVVN